MNRGSAFLADVPISIFRASMRPRFMNRGSGPREHPPEKMRWASMRPRFMNRGSSTAAGHHSRVLRRFNEAPIHESGKWSTESLDPLQSDGFNEAPIHESGKSSMARLLPSS